MALLNLAAYRNKEFGDPSKVAFDSTYSPTVGDNYLDYTGAFSNIPGLWSARRAFVQGQAADRDSDATMVDPRTTGGPAYYDLMRTVDGHRYRARVQLGSDGKAPTDIKWVQDDPASFSELTKDFAPVVLAGVGGLAAGGFLGGAGAAGAASGATNAALAESAVGTAGYGASSAGLGGGAGLLGATDGALGFGLEGGGGYIVPEGAGALGTGAGYTIPTIGGTAGGAVGGTGLLGSIVDAAIRNPGLTSAVVGGLLGGTGTEEEKPEGYKGPMPTITRGGWKPSVDPAYMPFQSVASLIKIPKRGK